MPPKVFSWRAVAAATAGAAHIARETPCQDAAGAGDAPRPFVIACDGRGSSPVSQHGSAAAVAAFPLLLHTLEPLLAQTLDAPVLDDDTAHRRWRQFANLVTRHFAALQADLARSRGGAAGDYEFTVAAGVVGEHRIGWFQVGDAALAARFAGEATAADAGSAAGDAAAGGTIGAGDATAGELRVVTAPDTGEFANETRFVRYPSVPEKHLHCDLFDAAALNALAAFSDGTASRMTRFSDNAPAPRFNSLFDDAATGALDAVALHAFLDEAQWQSTGDDRCMAILVRAAEAEETAVAKETTKAAEATETAKATDESETTGGAGATGEVIEATTGTAGTAGAAGENGENAAGGSGEGGSGENAEGGVADVEQVGHVGLVAVCAFGCAAAIGALAIFEPVMREPFTAGTAFVAGLAVLLLYRAAFIAPGAHCRRKCAEVRSVAQPAAVAQSAGVHTKQNTTKQSTPPKTRSQKHTHLKL